MPVDHYENFPVASLLLPRRLRRPIEAIYRFARSADDLADEGDASPEARLAALAAYGRELEAIAGQAPLDPALAPVFAPLAEAIAAHRLPLVPFHRLLAAFRQDVSQQRYADFAALSAYCSNSANPVGELLLHLFSRHTPENLAQSDAICTALQLTNFWQDAGEDWRRGRVYLPQDEMRRFGVDEAALAAGRCDAAWRALLDFQVARTRQLFRRGAPLVRALPGRFGWEIRLTVQGGLRILEKIELVGGDVFARAPRLGGRDWLLVALRAAMM